MTITCSTKVCSFGKQVVEKVETEYARFENGRFVYRISRSPMCEYMINFIHKLKHLPEKYMMNSVLENFTILQVCTIDQYEYYTFGWMIFFFCILMNLMNFYRSSQTETRRKRYSAQRTSSRSQRPSTVLSITYTDWSRTSLLDNSARRAAIHPHQCLSQTLISHVNTHTYKKSTHTHTYTRA